MAHRTDFLTLLLPILAPAIADAQTCPANGAGNFAAYVAVGSGSCALAGGLGTISNIRFGTSTTGAATVPDVSNFNISVNGSQITETFNLPNYPTSPPPFGTPSGTITFNFAFTLTLPVGSVANSASILIGGSGSTGSVATGGPATVNAAAAFCGGGIFLAFPPASCSGTERDLSALYYDAIPLPDNDHGTIAFPGTRNIDFFETLTVSGITSSATATQTFEVSTPSLSSVPLPSSLLLCVTGLGCLGLYLSRHNLLRNG